MKSGHERMTNSIGTANLHDMYNSDEESYILEEMPQIEMPIDGNRHQPTDTMHYRMQGVSTDSHISEIIADLPGLLGTSEDMTSFFDQTFLPHQPPVEQSVVQVVHRPVEADFTDIIPTLRTDLPNVSTSEIMWRSLFAQPSHNFSNSPLQPMETSVVYPVHPLKANGISYIADDGRLYATHRGKDNKRIVFGLTHLEQDKFPQARLAVYLSMPGVHETITACPSHRATFDSTDVMKVFYKGEHQTTIQTVKGCKAVICPLVDCITDDNDRTYQIEFNCFTSCVQKTYKGENLFVNFVICNTNGEELWKKSTLLKVSANPGRDSKVFNGEKKPKPTKRKSDESLSEPPVKREPSNDPCDYIDSTPMISPAARNMIETALPHISSAAKRQLFQKLNRRLGNLLKSEIEIFRDDQNATG